jgi:MOSC domain-containing protein YiiM
MTVEAIHLGAPRVAELWTVESVRAVAGKGLEGDRHFHEEGASPGQALTLVEAEVVEEVGLAPGETRRQLTVRGIKLNDLVGKRFRVGDVECFGVELCEPCLHLEELTRPGMIKALVHRAGINADIVSGGTIRVGDAVIVD